MNKKEYTTKDFSAMETQIFKLISHINNLEVEIRRLKINIRELESRIR